jgi:hypothetical protein
MNKLTAQDLDDARAVLEGEGPVVMYKYLAARGIDTRFLRVV